MIGAVGAAQQALEVLATNLRVEAALWRDLNVLGDLPVAVFKGPVLTRRIYGDLRRRASADNDLWVPPPYTREAVERFLRRGYRPVAGLSADAALRRDGQVALWPNGDDGEVSVDVHAHPFRGSYFDVPASLIEAHLEEVRVQGKPVRTFDTPLSFAHLVAHYVQHHFEAPLLSDIGAAWDAWAPQLGPDSGFVDLADRTCSLEAVEYALGGAARLGHLRAPLPEHSRLRARLCARFCPPEKLPAPVIRKFFSVLLVAPEKLPRGIVRAMLLEQDDLESRYGSGSRWSLILRHIARTLRGAPG